MGLPQPSTNGNSEPPPALYRACPTKRVRRTKADIDVVKQAILDVIGADPPMTVRQVFYQLVTRGVIEKTEREYQQTVIRLMTDMRLAGELPFDLVIDESRRRRITKTYDSVTDALEATAKFYRRSAVRDADDYLEIWCEKDALAGALWEVTSEYDVPLMDLARDAITNVPPRHRAGNLPRGRAREGDVHLPIRRLGPIRGVDPAIHRAPAGRDVRAAQLRSAGCREGRSHQTAHR
jgi:hypothetical protein